ncbi:MAG: nitrite reductase, copper-containing [Phototrophicales bacterium]|nr:MAG: nitrite reductase, copper-containing [Phototrophicales bacterium]
MNNKGVNPNIVGFVLISLIVLFFAVVPIHIDIGAPEVLATNATEQASKHTLRNREFANVSYTQQSEQVLEYTLSTIIGQTPPMAFIGVGGDIDGQINPTLTANVGDKIKLTVINGDPVLHDLKIDEFNVNTGELVEDGQTVVVEFVVDKPGEFEYYCSVVGHRDIGMHGKLRVVGEVVVGNREELYGSQPPTTTQNQPEPIQPAAENARIIVRNPADVPPPVGDRGPANIRVDMTTLEVTGFLADGTTFNYFTFDGTVPGPMLRVRVGDTIEFHLKNDATSIFPHSIDLHSVTGQGGGAVYTQTLPGGETSFTFKALNPGLYVYHCATASIPHHISSGMYGLILVEPTGGLPPVDREFYVMQGDIYTSHEYGTQGHQEFNMAHMRDERADYLVFNGAVGGLTSPEYALRANVGETVRIYFGVGGPNYTSSFHVIGEIFDRVYAEGSITSQPLTDIQTTLVPTGGAVIVEFKVDVPGTYILVDHSLSRLERGLVGYLIVEGEPQPDIYHSNVVGEESGH